MNFEIRYSIFIIRYSNYRQQIDAISAQPILFYPLSTAGILIVKVDPLFTSLVTVIRPWCLKTIP